MTAQTQHSSASATEQAPEVARAQIALQRSAATVEILKTHYLHEPFQIPYPFALHLGQQDSRDDSSLPRPPREVVQAVRDLQKALQPERDAIAQARCNPNSFVRYVNALIGGSDRTSGSGSHPDLIVDLLLDVKRPVEIDSGLRHAHHFTATSVKMLPALIRLGEFTNADYVLDLGCGNGRFAALLHLSSGCNAGGVEILPRLAEQGRALMKHNKLSAVKISPGNALTTDLSEATAIVMYAPFYAQMFRDMVVRLEERARLGAFRVILHGPMEKYLEESRHFKTSSSSSYFRRFDSIYEAAQPDALNLGSSAMPSRSHRR